MPKINYHQRPAVKALRTARTIIELSPGQVFTETPKAWVIWQEGPPHVVKRIPKKRVLFVYVKDGWGWCPGCEKDVEVDGRLDAAGIYDVCQECGERTI
jgi:hypothetical protein